MGIIGIIVLIIVGYFAYITLMDNTVHKKSYERERCGNEK